LTSTLGGRLTGGGAEGALARATLATPRTSTGYLNKVAEASRQMLTTGIREGGQEIFDEAGEAIGVQTAQILGGERSGYDFAEVRGRATVGFMAGAVLGALGGGVSVTLSRSQADEVLDELARHVERGTFDPAALDAVARALLDPNQAQIHVVKETTDVSATPVDAARDRATGAEPERSGGDTPPVPGGDQRGGADAAAPGSGTVSHLPVGAADPADGAALGTQPPAGAADHAEDAAPGAQPPAGAADHAEDAALDALLLEREAAAMASGDPLEVAVTALENQAARSGTAAPGPTEDAAPGPLETGVPDEPPPPVVQARADGTLQVGAPPATVRELLQMLGVTAPPALARGAGDTTVVGATQAATVAQAMALAYPEPQYTKEDLARVHLVAQQELGPAYDPAGVRLVSPRSLWHAPAGTRGTTRIDGPAAAFLAAAFDAAGRRLVFFEARGHAVGTGGFVVRGDGRTAYLNVAGAINPVTEAIHEATHLLQQSDPVAYAAYKAALQAAERGAPILDTSDAALLSWARESYFGADPAISRLPDLAAVLAHTNMSRESLLDEFIADATGVASAQKGFWRRVLQELARTDRNALRKLMAVLRQLTDQIRATLGAGASFPAIHRYIQDMDALVDAAAHFLATAHPPGSRCAPPGPGRCPCRCAGLADAGRAFRVAQNGRDDGTLQ
jgi:hypothetical protein